MVIDHEEHEDNDENDHDHDKHDDKDDHDHDGHDVHSDIDDHLNHDDHLDEDDHLDYDDHLPHEVHRIFKEAGGCTQESWRLLTASIALNDESLVSQSVRYVGIELLGHLKSHNNLNSTSSCLKGGPCIIMATLGLFQSHCCAQAAVLKDLAFQASTFKDWFLNFILALWVEIVVNCNIRKTN